MKRKDICNLEEEYCPNCKTYNVKQNSGYKEFINTNKENCVLMYDFICSNCNAKFRIN